MSSKYPNGYFAYVKNQCETQDARISKEQKFTHVKWNCVVTVDSIWWADGHVYVVFMTNVDNPGFWGKGSLQNEEINKFIKNTVPYREIDCREINDACVNCID
jgi:hypothetical protein